MYELVTEWTLDNAFLKAFVASVAFGFLHFWLVVAVAVPTPTTLTGGALAFGFVASWLLALSMVRSSLGPLVPRSSGPFLGPLFPWSPGLPNPGATLP